MMMHEYEAIRNEVVTSLGAQVAVLSFGAATLGLMVAAAAEIWSDAGIVASLLLIWGVPAVCFLTLSMHAFEMVRIMRASLFIHDIERCVNEAYRQDGGNNSNAGILLWEQWMSQRGQYDMATRSRTILTTTFTFLAFSFIAVGGVRLYTTLRRHELVHDILVAIPALGMAGVAVCLVLWAWAWVDNLYDYARALRNINNNEQGQ